MRYLKQIFLYCTFYTVLVMSLVVIMNMFGKQYFVNQITYLFLLPFNFPFNAISEQSFRHEKDEKQR